MNNPVQGPAPKKGASVVTIVLAVVGAFVLLGFGSCLVGAFWLKHEAESVLSAEGGGLVLSSPPEVIAALAGDRHEYVGDWVGQGDAVDRLVIAKDGTLVHDKKHGGSHNTTRGPISAFHGNDVQLKVFATVTFVVSAPPHQVAGRWHMTVDGVDYERESADPSGAIDEDLSDGGR